MVCAGPDPVAGVCEEALRPRQHDQDGGCDDDADGQAGPTKPIRATDQRDDRHTTPDNKGLRNYKDTILG